MQVIYRLTAPNGAVYIGQTRRLKGRMSAYRNLVCKQQRLLYRSLVKYGFENHTLTVVHRFAAPVSQRIIDNYEKYVIGWHRLMMRCEMLNLTPGGSGNGPFTCPRPRIRPDVQGEKNKDAKLTENDVRDIRAVYRKGERWNGLRQLARRYGVSLRAIWNVVNHKTWKHVTGRSTGDGDQIRAAIEGIGRDRYATISRARYPQRERVPCAATKTKSRGVVQMQEARTKEEREFCEEMTRQAVSKYIGGEASDARLK